MERTGIAVHGSTGSIGTQTLDVVKRLRGRLDFDVVALVCNSNIRVMETQILEHRPKYAVVADEAKAAELRQKLSGKAAGTEILSGQENATAVCGYEEVEVDVIATAGFAGLEPTLMAIEKGKRIATANKETFLAAGKLVMDAAKRKGVEVLPIDSEPSAMWQCLEPEVWDGKEGRHSVIWNLHRGADNFINYFLLTGSGGPFLRTDLKEMDRATPEQALKHPTWSMGSLITTRSATMMNKGMERIETSAIFGVPLDMVRVVIHPQSIVHSGVVLKDGSQKVQQGPHDMRYPIQYSLSFPYRFDTGLPGLRLSEVGRLDFEEPDQNRFPCLRIAEKAGRTGGTAPAILNGADETAVDAFLKGRIHFGDMPKVVEAVLDSCTAVQNPTLKQIIDADRNSRERAAEEIEGIRRTNNRT